MGFGLNSFGWSGSSSSGVVVNAANNGLYLSGTTVRMGTNPLIENTDIKMATFNWRVSSGAVPVLFTEPTTNRVGIRTALPQYGTHAVGTDLASATIAQSIFTDNTALAPTFRTLFARGTEATPVDTPSGAVIGQHYYSAYNGTSFIDSIRCRVVTNEAITGTGNSARMIYSFKPIGSTVFTDNIIMNQSGTMFYVLQDTVGTGAKGISINFMTLGEVFYIDDNGQTQFNANAGVRVKGSNGMIDLVSNGGTNPQIAFYYANGVSTSGKLYGAGASMFMECPMFGIGTVNFTTSAFYHIRSAGATSATFGLKIENSTPTLLFSVRDDGLVAASKSFTMSNNTPITGIADSFEMYATDIVAGNSAPHFRTENGDIIKLFKSAAYTVTNVTTDRSYNANVTSIGELADVLGTLISDLQATGLIG